MPKQPPNLPDKGDRCFRRGQPNGDQGTVIRVAGPDSEIPLACSVDWHRGKVHTQICSLWELEKCHSEPMEQAGNWITKELDDLRGQLKLMTEERDKMNQLRREAHEETHALRSCCDALRRKLDQTKEVLG